MNIVIVGHVDHGKSTVIGRLLADTDSLPQGKLEQVREMCRRNSKPFEYAFLLDALKDERSQGITIDAARCFFKTAKRDYLIIDAPGHIEFLKNMITGASRAEAALLVIDANEGVRENSRRHGYMLKMLGIKQVAVLVNKMDLADYSEEVFKSIEAEYRGFLEEIGIRAKSFIPVSAMQGDNIAAQSSDMTWYKGRTVLEELDAFDEKESEADSLPFRMPVQDVYRFTGSGDDRRIIAGTVESGRLKIGDECVFYPSGKHTHVATFEHFGAGETPTEIKTDMAAGFTMTEQIYIRRGEICCLSGEKTPKVGTSFVASLFWLGISPMVKEKNYLLKIGAAKVPCQLKEIISTLDASTLDRGKKDKIDRHDVAECIIECSKPIAFDLTSEMPKTSRFVLVDEYEISGGGIITAEVEKTGISDVARDLAMRRNEKWETSSIPSELRAKRFGQRPGIVIITGHRYIGKKAMAKELERELWDAGRQVYFLGIGNLLYGVAGEIKVEGEIPDRYEHIRRLGEVANIMMDSGMLLLVTCAEFTANDMEVLEATVDTEHIHTVWLGDKVTTDVVPDLAISDASDRDATAVRIKSFMAERGLIFI
ncbi:MAG: GTP-binding protein [Clostridiales bacterium]|jgi:bifunctional enzyme CysN/CysC|nr:GTP-binding protein [Clostridiales bacterium]